MGNRQDELDFFGLLLEAIIVGRYGDDRGLVPWNGDVVPPWVEEMPRRHTVPVCEGPHTFTRESEPECATCGAHEHECPSCREVWAHRREDLVDGDAFADAHRCRHCGTEQVFKRRHVF